MSKTTNKVKSSKNDLIFDIFSYAFLGIAFLLVFYPLYFVIIASFSDPSLVGSGEVWLYPKGVSIDGYKRIFQDPDIINGYGNAIFYTVLGTVINLICTIPAAYALSRSDLVGRKGFNYGLVFAMFFSGGMIPTFMLINNTLKIYDTVWALVLVGAVIPWNLIIARTFFANSLPGELREAATIDGCDDFKFFFKIALPLSGALMAIMILFYGVSHWNSYFNAFIYLKTESKFPLVLVLRNILIMNQASADMMGDVTEVAKKMIIAEQLKYGSIIIAALPLLIVYPFVQKYFVKGVMIGAVKG